MIGTRYPCRRGQKSQASSPSPDSGYGLGEQGPEGGAKPRHFGEAAVTVLPSGVRQHKKRVKENGVKLDGGATLQRLVQVMQEAWSRTTL